MKLLHELLRRQQPGETLDACPVWLRKLDQRERNDAILQCLTSGGLLQSFPQAAWEMVEAGELACFPKNSKIITKGNTDDDVYFVIHGKVTVERGKGGPIDREAQVTVGEMAAIETGKARNATVWAKHGTVATLRVPARDFVNMLAKYPDIEKRLDLDLRGRFYTLLDHVHQLEETLERRNAPYFWLFTSLIALLFGAVAFLVASDSSSSTLLAAIFGTAVAVGVFYVAVQLNPTYRFSRALKIAVFAVVTANSMPSLVASYNGGDLQAEVATPVLSLSSLVLFAIVIVCLSWLADRKEP